LTAATRDQYDLLEQLLLFVARRIFHMDARYKAQLKSYCDELLAHWKGLKPLINKPVTLADCLKTTICMRQSQVQLCEMVLSGPKQQPGVILVVLE
jgi:hypothetical protein